MISILNDICLEGSERLLVHMDCMNSLGQIVKIEDVDDMGGQCWTYIRVSIHDINAGNQIHTIAIGDTFIFSPNFSLLQQNQTNSNSEPTFLDIAYFSHTQDSFCMTHMIPTFRCCFGTGIEEIRARNLISASKSIHL